MSNAPEKTTSMPLEEVFSIAATLKQDDVITVYYRVTAATKGSNDVPNWTVRKGKVHAPVDLSASTKGKRIYAQVVYLDTPVDSAETFPEDGKHDSRQLTYGRIDVVRAKVETPVAPPPAVKVPAQTGNVEAPVDPTGPGRVLKIIDRDHQDDGDNDDEEPDGLDGLVIYDREKEFDMSPEVDIEKQGNFMDPAKWVDIINSKPMLKEMWKVWESMFKGKGRDKDHNGEIDRTIAGLKQRSADLCRFPGKLLDGMFMQQVYDNLWFLQGVINRRTYKKEVCDMMDRAYESNGKAAWIKGIEVEALQQAKILGLGSSPFLLTNHGGNHGGNRGGSGGGGNQGGGHQGGGYQGGGGHHDGGNHGGGGGGGGNQDGGNQGGGGNRSGGGGNQGGGGNRGGGNHSNGTSQGGGGNRSGGGGNDHRGNQRSNDPPQAPANNPNKAKSAQPPPKSSKQKALDLGEDF